jgi:hypothetical protein
MAPRPTTIVSNLFAILPLVLVQNVQAVRWFDKLLTMSGSNAARPEFVEGLAPFNRVTAVFVEGVIVC